MSIKVTVGNSNNINTNIVSKKTINTNIVSKKTSTRVETLANVDAKDLQDGYTLVFNSATNKWEAVNPSSEFVLGAIDGGTY
jgi:hypothetical protein